MTQTVYAVLGNWAYEGSDLVSVWCDEESAKTELPDVSENFDSADVKPMTLRGGVAELTTEQLYAKVEDLGYYVDFDISNTGKVALDGFYSLNDLEVIVELARRKAAADA